MSEAQKEVTQDLIDLAIELSKQSLEAESPIVHVDKQLEFFAGLGTRQVLQIRKQVDMALNLVGRFKFLVALGPVILAASDDFGEMGKIADDMSTISPDQMGGYVEIDQVETIINRMPLEDPLPQFRGRTSSVSLSMLRPQQDKLHQE